MNTEDQREKPIGVFDSGVGGLTVVAEIIRQLPGENIVYFGDVGRTPYGGRSKEQIIKFTRQDVNFMREHKVKFVVAACNTVSAAALDTVKSDYETEILGVITPGAKAAVGATHNKRVGIIGTVATISSDSYAREIQKLSADIKVFSLACPLFVPLVEEGYIDKEATRLIAEDYLQTLIDVDIDTLVLGCTHYPLLKHVIASVMGKGVKLIDSAEATAHELAEILSHNNLMRPWTSDTSHKYYVSDVPDRFSQVAGQFLGHNIPNITRVDITRY